MLNAQSMMHDFELYLFNIFFGESNVKIISTANSDRVKCVTISKRRKPVRAALNRNSIYCG